MKKTFKKCNFHLPSLSDLWLDGKLHGNSRFCRIALYFFTAISPGTTLKMSLKTVKMSLKKSLKSAWIFFFKPVLNHEKS